jgi:hypothetical protein
MKTKTKKKPETVPSKLARFVQPIVALDEVVEGFDKLDETEDFKTVAEILLEVKAQAKALAAEFDEEVAPFKTALAHKKGEYDPTIKRYATVEAACKVLMSAYLVASEAEAAGLRAAADKTKDPKRAAELYAQADALVPKVTGISSTLKTRITIKHADKVPDAFKKLVIDEDAIERAIDRGESVLGVTVTHEYQISVTPARAGKVVE